MCVCVCIYINKQKYIYIYIYVDNLSAYLTRLGAVNPLTPNPEPQVTVQLCCLLGPLPASEAEWAMHTATRPFDGETFRTHTHKRGRRRAPNPERGFLRGPGNSRIHPGLNLSSGCRMLQSGLLPLNPSFKGRGPRVGYKNKTSMQVDS